MRHQEKYGKNEIMECKRIPVSDMKGIVDTIKNDLSTMEKDIDYKQKSRPPRIPDLSIDDKRKILGLINMLGKMNEDKDKYCEQVANYCNEVKSFQSEISRIKEVHQYEKLNFCTRVKQLFFEFKLNLKMHQIQKMVIDLTCADKITGPT